MDADHFVFYLNERQRSVVLERLRQIERGIRRLSDKMGVLHVVPRFGVYAMRPEEDVRRACELSNLALGAAEGSGDNAVAFYQDVDQNAFFESMQIEDRFDAAIARPSVQGLLSAQVQSQIRRDCRRGSARPLGAGGRQHDPARALHPAV